MLEGKQQVIDWLLNNQVVIKEVVAKVNSRLITSGPVVYCQEEVEEQRLHEIKKSIVDEISMNTGLTCDILYSTIDNEELENYLKELK